MLCYTPRRYFSSLFAFVLMEDCPPWSFRVCVVSPFLLLLRGFMTTAKPHHHLSLLKASSGIQRAAQSYLLCVQGAPGQGRPLGTAWPREAQDRELALQAQCLPGLAKLGGHPGLGVPAST